MAEPLTVKFEIDVEEVMDRLKSVSSALDAIDRKLGRFVDLLEDQDKKGRS